MSQFPIGIDVLVLILILILMLILLLYAANIYMITYQLILKPWNR